MYDGPEMKNFIILIPVYNDWESLSKLLNQINLSIENYSEHSFKCIIINDASTIKNFTIKVPKNISCVELINMSKNKGHARCNAFGIRYLAEKDDYDFVIMMDGDGEDRPEELTLLIDEILSNQNLSVVAKRVKRSEGPLFQFLYQFHKLLTIVSTGKNINFGNYSCLTKKDIKILSTKVSLWSSFSGSVKMHILNFNYINSIRGLRYFGPSKMSLYNLGIHSLSIIAVFKNQVFIRSAILLFISSFLSFKMNFFISTFQILLIIFNLLIYIVSLREKKVDFLNSKSDIESTKEYLQK